VNKSYPPKCVSLSTLVAGAHFLRFHISLISADVLIRKIFHVYGSKVIWDTYVYGQMGVSFAVLCDFPHDAGIVSLLLALATALSGFSLC